jgi:hypothetical protein
VILAPVLGVLGIALVVSDVRHRHRVVRRQQAEAEPRTLGDEVETWLRNQG